MDSFIFYGDYAKQIQEDNLLQVVGNKTSILNSIQLAAVEECVSYLKQKYDITQAFQPITQHDITKPYKSGQTVYLNAPAYDATKTYALGSFVAQSDKIYKCTTAIAAHEAFNVAHWSLVGDQYAIYYAKYTQDSFYYKAIYTVGNKVFWCDKIYTCRIATQILDHEALLQIGVSGTSKIVNIFPDDPVKGVQYWGAGTPFSIPASTEISNTDYWIFGDNRDQKLLQICIDIALYHAHCRISPRNIPDLRIRRYIGDANDREIRGQRILYPTYSALGWLQSAAIGNDITPSLPLLQPAQGGRIRFGGNQKNVNNY